MAIFQPFWLFVLTKLHLTRQIVSLIQNSNFTARVIISQEQSWPSGLLLYLISHKWVQCLFSWQNCWSNIVLSRCFCWTVLKTISSTVNVYNACVTFRHEQVSRKTRQTLLICETEPMIKWSPQSFLFKYLFLMGAEQ